MALLKICGLSFCLLFLNSCMFTYLIKSGAGQLSLMSDRVKIEEALKEKNLSSEDKRKLQLVIDVKKFAESELGLKPTKNYSSFVKLEQDYVSYLLRVSPIYKLETHKWSFPFMGSFPYLGFFDKEDALEEAEEFASDKYDTYVRGVSAYSTLGWFNDPILSSMLRYKDYNLVNTIIHETVHATLFIKDHADFNERLATFLGNKGTEIYYLKSEGQNSPTLSRVKDENHDDKIFSKFISQEIEELKTWYKNPEHHDLKQKKLRLKTIQDKFNADLAPQLKSKRYLYFKDIELNNARLLPFQTYTKDLSEFEKVYLKFNSDFKETLNYFKRLEDSDDPLKEMSKN